MTRHLVWTVGLAILAGMALSSWRIFVGDPVTDAAERRLLDARFQVRGPWKEEPSVVVVAVDEVAVARIGGRAELRNALAIALPKILDAQPRAVAVDLLFAEQTAADPFLIDALASDRRVLVAAAAFDGRPTERKRASPEIEAALDRSAIPVVAGDIDSLPVRNLLLPTPAIASAARLGHVNLIRTTDGVARAVPMALRTASGQMLPSLPLAAVATYAQADIVLISGRNVIVGPYSAPIDEANRIIVDHFGPGGAVPRVGLAAVIDGTAPAEAFRDRIVFIGATAESLGDIVATPFDRDVSGVEILAGVAAGLMQGRTIRRDAVALALTFAVASLLSAAAAAAGRSHVIPRVIAANVALAFAGAAAAQYAFGAHSLWLDAVAIIGSVGLGGVIGAVARHRHMSDRTRRLVQERSNLAHFVAPQLADRLAAEGAPGFQRRTQQAAVLFVDVEGFTAFAEHASDAELGDFLSNLHGYIEECAAARHGVIVDFQGDGAMIAFGLPEARPDDAARALACAIVLARREGWRPSERFEHLHFRASAHFGPVLAAVLGGARQAVVTLAGDTVNLAARLQETAKENGLALAVTRELMSAARPYGEAPEVPLRPAVTATVRGRTQTTEIWTLRDPAD